MKTLTGLRETERKELISDKIKNERKSDARSRDTDRWSSRAAGW